MSNDTIKYLDKPLTLEQLKAIKDMIEHFRDMPFKNNYSIGMMEKYYLDKQAERLVNSEDNRENYSIDNEE